MRVCQRCLVFALLLSIVCVPPLARAHQRITPPNAPSQEATRFNQRADGIPKKASVTVAVAIVRIDVDVWADDPSIVRTVDGVETPAAARPPALGSLALRAPPRPLRS